MKPAPVRVNVALAVVPYFTGVMVATTNIEKLDFGQSKLGCHPSAKCAAPRVQSHIDRVPSVVQSTESVPAKKFSQTPTNGE